MNLRTQIEEWFRADCPFLLGVALYQQTGGAYPLSYFQGYEKAAFVPDDVQARLNQALRLTLEELPSPTPEMSENATNDLNDDNALNVEGPKPSESEPAIIQQLRKEAIGLHKTHSLVHARMVDAITDEDRYEFACQIMEDIIPSLDAIYDKIRAWQSSGDLPTATTTNRDRYIIDKMLRRNSLKSRISRIKNLLKKDLAEPDRAKLNVELLEKQVELKEIEEELDL